MKLSRPTPLTSRPLVTVVIPCYNYARYLPEAVESALSQVDIDLEVLIVDDASTDGSTQAAARLAALDRRIRVIEHDSNKGHIQTYNDGIDQANGKYTVLLSADDLLAPGSLSRSLGLLEAKPDVTFVYGYAESFTGLPRVPARQRTTTWTVWTGRDWIDRVCRRGNNVVVNPEVVMRTEVLRACGGYDPAQPQAADMYLWLRAASAGDVGRVNGPAQAYYRIHDSNMHLTDFAGVLTDMRARRQVFEAFWSDVDDATRRARLRRWSGRAMAREAVRIACCVADGNFETGGPAPAAYCDLALTLWPAIRWSTLWRAYQRRTSDTLPDWRRRVFALEWDLRNRIRWRRWRRFGT